MHRKREGCSDSAFGLPNAMLDRQNSTLKLVDAMREARHRSTWIAKDTGTEFQRERVLHVELSGISKQDAILANVQKLGERRTSEGVGGSL